MRFLVHGNLSPAVATALRRHGHAVEEIAASAELSPHELLEQCHVKQLDLVTNDADLVHGTIESPPAKFGRCIVFLQLPGGEVEQDDAVDRLFQRFKRLSPKKLYTVTETRVKVRQLAEQQ